MRHVTPDALQVHMELARLVGFEKFKNKLWQEDFDKAGKLERPKSPFIVKNLLSPFHKLLVTELKSIDKLD